MNANPAGWRAVRKAKAKRGARHRGGGLEEPVCRPGPNFALPPEHKQLLTPTLPRNACGPAEAYVLVARMNQGGEPVVPA